MIKVGDTLPAAVLKTLTDTGIENINLNEYLKGKKVIFFAVPGAYTGVCTTKHLPGYVELFDTIKATGVDEIICVSVNDPLVMDAWGSAGNAKGKVTFLSDWDASFSKSLGLTFDGSGLGLGIRSLRYTSIIDNGKITHLNVEDNPGECSISHASEILKHL